MFQEISAYAKINSLVHQHPIEKLFISIFPVIILGYSKDFLPIFINIVVFSFLHFIHQHPYKFVFKFTIGIAAFSLISSIGILFDYGIYQTSIIILKTVNGGICLSYLALTTPIDHILFIFSKWEPLKEGCDIAKNMERFIFLMENEYTIMVKAIQCRGGFRGIKGRVKDMSKIGAVLFINVLKRWNEIKDVLDARCYRGYTSYYSVSFSWSVKRMFFILLYSTFLVSSLYIG